MNRLGRAFINLTEIACGFGKVFLVVIIIVGVAVFHRLCGVKRFCGYSH